jgi:pullulanase
MKKLFAVVLCLLVAPVAWSVTTSGTGTDPYGVTIFVRGGFNDWGTANAMTYDAAAGTYHADIALDVGNYEFKIASEDWSTVDLGAGDTGDQVVVPGVPRLIGTGPFGNLQLSITTAAVYGFWLDPSTGLTTPTLLVQAIPLPAAALLFGSAVLGLGFARKRRR